MRYFLSVTLLCILSLADYCKGTEYKFRPVTPEYNEQLQQFCANPQFQDSGAEHKVMHGTAVAKGKYPWAVALTWKGGSMCGGTLISPRHVITARHCIEKIHQFAPVSVKVGGVCHSVSPSDDCPHSDMREVAVEFAAYEPRVDADLEGVNNTIKIRNMEHDLAIIQLKEDLVQHFGKESASDDTRVACLPQPHDLIPKIMHVYGWGLTETHSTGSPRLMEVELAIMNTTNDPLLQNPKYQQNVISKICVADHLYCMHPKEGNTNQDGAGGDSGSGIIGRRGPLAILFGSTIAGADPAAGFIMNIATKTQAFEYDICHFSGVCTQKDWVGKTDENKVNLKYRAFFDPQKPQNIEI